MEAANNLVMEFCKSIGMEPLGLDQDNQRSLAFDDKLIVSFIGEKNDGLVGMAYIGDVKKDADCRVFLEQNFMPDAHGGGRFALEPESNRVVLTNIWNAARIDVTKFSSELEQFINSGMRAQEFLERGGAQAKSETPAAAAEEKSATLPDSMAHYQNML